VRNRSDIKKEFLQEGLDQKLWKNIDHKNNYKEKEMQQVNGEREIVAVKQP